MRDVGNLEEERKIGGEAGADQVLHDLGLPVDDDRAAAGQLAQRNSMALAVELELDPVVDEPFSLQPRADPRVDEEVGDRLLENPCANSVLDVLAAPVLEHH